MWKLCLRMYRRVHCWRSLVVGLIYNLYELFHVHRNIQALRGLHEEFLAALNSIMTAPSFAGEIFYDNVCNLKRIPSHFYLHCHLAD